MPHTSSIKNWTEEDRPREKLLHKGGEALTQAELLGILLGSGNKEQNAVQLAQHILDDTNNNLGELSRLSIPELMRYKGIGEAKAITIAAALELGRRRITEKAIKRSKISSSKDAYEILKPHLQDLNHERFYVILLSRSNAVIKTVCISTGGVAGTLVDRKIIFKTALQYLASSIILSHNHPSGNLNPSPQDKELTVSLVEGGRLIDIKILDHLIITQDAYYSFADEGMI